jgi:hypothetical protein
MGQCSPMESTSAIPINGRVSLRSTGQTIGTTGAAVNYLRGWFEGAKGTSTAYVTGGESIAGENLFLEGFFRFRVDGSFDPLVRCLDYAVASAYSEEFICQKDIA